MVILATVTAKCQQQDTQRHLRESSSASNSAHEIKDGEAGKICKAAEIKRASPIATCCLGLQLGLVVIQVSRGRSFTCGQWAQGRREEQDSLQWLMHHTR